MKTLKNRLLFLLYTVLLGAIVGAIIWGFLRVMHLSITFFWDYLPSQIDFPFYTLCVCTAGGVLIGLYKKRFGDYPEELPAVIGQVKKTGRYPYHNVFSILGAALLPLVFGASVGPEAGLTGVIAGLCSWVGDKLKRFHTDLEELTSIGMSATLGTIFRSPMFGFFEPIESEKDAVLPKTEKIVLYFSAILSSFGMFSLLNLLFGAAGGIEGVAAEQIDPLAYLSAIGLTLVGILAGYLYFLFKKLTAALSKQFYKYTILRATAGGLLLGVAGTFLPLTMFSGEHQIGDVMKDGAAIGAVMLVAIGVLKLLLTNICIDSGLKGGHFFPIIFCGVCFGYAMSLWFGLPVSLCTAVVTTALVGHTLKKPVATVLLMLLLFPLRLVPIMLFAAIAAKFIPTPKFLLPESEEKRTPQAPKTA